MDTLDWFFLISGGCFSVAGLLMLSDYYDQTSVWKHPFRAKYAPRYFLFAGATTIAIALLPSPYESIVALAGAVPMYVGIICILGFPTLTERFIAWLNTKPLTPLTLSRREYTEAVMQRLQIPQQLVEPVREAIYKYTDSETYKKQLALTPTDYLTRSEIERVNNPATLAESINAYASILPKNIGRVGTGKLWHEYWTPETAHLHYSVMDIPKYLMTILANIKIELVVPPELRTQHWMVCASSGYGKSQLFQNTILDDLETDAAIVVIDSQNDLINKLATRIDPDRLTLIDPVHCPPPLNIFDVGKDNLTNDNAKNNRLQLLEYTFQAFDAKMTSKQAMMYRYLCKWMMVWGYPISTLIEILQKSDTPAMSKFIIDHTDDMPITDRVFFEEFVKPRGNQYTETKQELLRRLLTLMESKPFREMFDATTCYDIQKDIEQGKVILINTAKPTQGLGAAILGRFFLATIKQSVMQGSRKPVRLFVDEFADYASDDLEELFTQSRKYNLAMTVAFQNLAQLPNRLEAIMATNTAIKFAGGVSAEDRANLARQMDVEPEFIAKAKRGTFAAWFRDIGATYFPVEFGRLEKLPELRSLSEVHAEMRRRYSPPAAPPPPVVDAAPFLVPEKTRKGKRVEDFEDE